MRNISGKGGRISQESADRLNTLLTIASSRLLGYCEEMFIMYMAEERDKLPYKLPLSLAEKKSKKIDNSGRMYSTVFWHPGNDLFLSMHYHTFRRCICSYTVVVQDGYILASPSTARSFCPFSHDPVLSAFCQCDEECVSLK